MQSRITMSKETGKSSSKSLEKQVIKHSVGIDISKEKFEVCYKAMDIEQCTHIKGSRSFSNTPSGFKAFHAWSMKRKKEGIRQVFVMESTGVYYEGLAFYLYDAGLYVSVVLPSRSKRYLQGLGLKSKTDKIDASGLAQMGAEQKLALWKRPDNWTIGLRQHTCQREQLQETRTSLLNQKEALVHSGYPNVELIGHLQELITLIGKQLKELEQSVEQQLRQDDSKRKKIENLCSIKGVSKLTVAVILAETNCFEDFHSRSQLVSYAGYDVVSNQTGKHTGLTHISKQGNSHIRRALHLPAFTIKSTGFDPVFTGLWERVYERTRKKMKAYVALQRKLLVLLYTLWKNDVGYIAGYQRQSPAQRQG